MSELSPLNDVIADDLLLDRIGSGAGSDSEPLAVVLGALATYAAGPVPHRPHRRSRRHRLLSGLAVLAVGASGAGVAAAVTLPHQGVPDDALAVHAPAPARAAVPDNSSGSVLSEVRLSAVAFGGASPVTGQWRDPWFGVPDGAPGTSGVADAAPARDHVVTGGTASPSVAGSPASETNGPSTVAGSPTSAAGTPASGASSPGSGAGSPGAAAGSGRSGSQGAGDDAPAGDPGAGTPGSADSGTAEVPSPGPGTPESGGSAPAPGADGSDSSSSASDTGQGPEPGGTVRVPAHQPVDGRSRNGLGNGQVAGPGQGVDATQPAGKATAPGQVKRQLQTDAQLPPDGATAPASAAVQVASRAAQAPGQVKRAGSSTPATSGDAATSVPD